VVEVIGLPGASFLAVRFELVLNQPFGFCRFGLHRDAPGLAAVFETRTPSSCRGIVCFSLNEAPPSTPSAGGATFCAFFFALHIQDARRGEWRLGFTQNAATARGYVRTLHAAWRITANGEERD